MFFDLLHKKISMKGYDQNHIPGSYHASFKLSAVFLILVQGNTEA